MRRLKIGGRDVETAKSFEVRSPFDGFVVGEVALADPAQVEAAISAAEAARPKVARLTRAERGTILAKVSDDLTRLKGDIALVLAREVGKTIKEARTEVERAASTFAVASEEAKRLGGEVIPFDATPAGAGRKGFSTRVPIGTVVAITPFNFPLNLAAHKVAPAIAAGNPFVLKPASQTPIADHIMCSLILEAGFPPEGLGFIAGPGATVGTELVRDPRPRMVTFTGSAEVGKTIAREAGLKRLAMELGSNSAVIVTPSADTEFAAERIAQGGYALAGQVCISVQRVIVHETIFDEIVGRVVRIAEGLRVGDPVDEATQMGPMISEHAARGFEAWIEEAAAAGASVATGAVRRGSLCAPTVLARVPKDTRIWKEEAFAPVVCINPYSTFGDAIDTVNESRYGLQAGVFTRSIEEAFEAIERLDVGGVIVNDVPTYRVDHMPYGGVKDSGIGREGLRYAIHEMTEEKLACFNFWRP